MHLDLSSAFSGLSPYIEPNLLAEIVAFVQVVFIDIVMAGDNALAVGIAASGLPAKRRPVAIVCGLIGAIAVRIGFVLLTVQLFKVVGLLLAGGLLLLWVCAKMWQELDKETREARAEHQLAMATGVKIPVDPNAPKPGRAKHTTLFSAIISILFADISMSLDNVLAVTGAAENHIEVLAFGLLFSIAAMGIAANLIAKVLHKYRWVGYVGVIVVLLVALRMTYQGGMEVWTTCHCDMTLKCVPDTWHQTVAWWQALMSKA